mmetsp:Transcript_6911/g.19473  ORF Transcript_6911/g.19473 Transcript_6911/m.19473 type:complete len:335 (-) Transcript_6911:1490-2494(-)
MSSEQNPSFPAEPADAPPEPGMPVKLTCCSSLALPEGSDLTGLQCEFSGTPSACVPASYEGGAITCIAPWQLEKDLSVKVKTLKGDVLCEETIRLAALSQPLLEAPESPCSVDVPEGEAPKRGMVQYMKNHYSALKPFVIISSSYLLFTVTDGAVRMIVLLHAYNLGFSAFETALLFMLYELAGVVTNLLAGAAGARWGIKTTLLTGLSFQLLGFAMLMGWQVGRISFHAYFRHLICPNRSPFDTCYPLVSRRRTCFDPSNSCRMNGESLEIAGKECSMSPLPRCGAASRRTSQSWAARQSPSLSPPTRNRASSSSSCPLSLGSRTPSRVLATS